MKITYKYILLLPFITFACQSSSDEGKTIASTHPKLENQLKEDSVQTPYISGDSSNLYQRYQITTEEWLSNKSYQVTNMYGGKLAALDRNSQYDVKQHGTALQEGLRQGVNFAGQYTVVSVSCGTTCRTHYIIDRQNGKIIDKLQSSTGASYSKNSKAFILNPPDSTINYNNCHDCEPKAFLIEEGQLKEIQQ
ncbi:hypothetical protein [Pontibacter sp. SGAir0037]|uniref:hypothetical protein n=1 Tax=Pontibacter sp. SGAir0037 TaxID=2571030 RepID=UPI0010CCE512|nr:hypothetical protein [Pontibacter sp. SGAir0037]QCR22043.1 hypothetical protein C1N53_06620 [Pontibacter sp. SGAir0037]